MLSRGRRDSRGCVMGLLIGLIYLTTVDPSALSIFSLPSTPMYLTSLISLGCSVNFFPSIIHLAWDGLDSRNKFRSTWVLIVLPFVCGFGHHPSSPGVVIVVNDHGSIR